MNEWHLTVLVVMAIAGGAISGWKEAGMIVAGKTLNKYLLTAFRVSLALMAIAALTPDGEAGLPQILMCLGMMMGAWAPWHRLVLNSRRIQLGHRIPINHLGTGHYDRFWMTVSRGKMTLAFVLMSLFEFALSYGLYQQLQNQ